MNAEHSISLIGLTGPIGSGKSTVAEILAEQGAIVIDADLLAREAVRPGSGTLTRIQDMFGEEYITPEGGLNRAALAKLIFATDDLREKLEAITHPRIQKLFQERMQEIAQDESAAGKPVIYMAPLLDAELVKRNSIEKTIVVTAPVETCLNRIVERDGIDRDAAEQRYHAQIDRSLKAENADYVIENNDSLDTLRQNTIDIYRELSGD